MMQSGSFPAGMDVTVNRESAREVKFLIDPARAKDVRQWARTRMDRDPFAAGDSGDNYRTTSLYFDTNQFDIFHRRGSFARSKYRIRRYGAAEGIFLERKLRTRELVSKRRSIVDIHDLQRLEETEATPGWPGFWFHRRLLLRQLKPVCQIAYARTARIAKADYGQMRLTIDEDIRALPVESLMFDHGSEGLLLSDREHVLELKYVRQMPALFKQLIAEFTLEPVRFSKYRLAAERLGCVHAPIQFPKEGDAQGHGRHQDEALRIGRYA
jgi:hypothetical protein